MYVANFLEARSHVWSVEGGFAFPRLGKRDCPVRGVFDEDATIHYSFQDTSFLKASPQNVFAWIRRVFVESKMEGSVAAEIVRKRFGLLN